MKTKQILTLIILVTQLLYSYHSFAQDNTPPEVIGEIENQTIPEDQHFNLELKLNDIFSDESPLTFSVNLNNADWLANVGDSTLVGFPLEEHVGDYNISVKATDSSGNTNSTSFTITVTAVDDKPIVLKNLPGQLQRPGFKELKINYKGTFYDEEDKSLNYAVESSYPAVATAELVGDYIVVTEKGLGPAEIILTATDSHGNRTKTKMFIRVFEEAEILNMTTANTGSNSLSNSRITCVRNDYSGNIWAAGRNEINKYNNGIWEQFTFEEEANGYIEEIWDDNKGNVYFISFGHFIKYDGETFSFIDKRADPVLPDYIWHTCISNDSVLYIAGYNISENNDYTIVRSTASGWETIYNESREEGVFERESYQMCTDASNNLWLTTKNGLELVQNGSRTLITNNYNTSEYIWDMKTDIWGNIWFNTSSEVYQYNVSENTLQEYNIQKGYCIHADDIGNIWIGQNFGQITKIKNNTLTQYSLKDPISRELMLGGNNYINNISKTNDGRYWLCSEYGLFIIENYLLKDESTIIQNTYDGLVSNEVNDIYRDSEGNYFINTYSGVSKYDGLKWKFLGRTYEVHCIDKDDNKLCSDFSGGLVIVDKDEKKTVYPMSLTQSGGINDIIVDKDNTIWIAGHNGIAKFDRQSWTYYTTDDGLLDNAIFLLYADSKGNIWIEYVYKHLESTKYTISKFDGNSFKHHTFIDGEYDKKINAFLEDKDGNIWMGGINQGLIKYDGDNYIFYIEGLKSKDISSLSLDYEGGIWVVYNQYYDGYGVSRFDGTKFDHFTKDDGLPTNKIKHIYVENALTNQNKSAHLYNDEISELVWFGFKDKGIANLSRQITTAVKQPELPDMQIAVFPNPTTGIIKINLDNTPREFIDIEILSISGSKVYQSKTSNLANNVQVNLSSNPPGTYFIRLKSDIDSVVKKIVKQ